MTTIHITITSQLSPERVLAAGYDFSARRTKVFPAVRTNAICPGPVETPLLMDWLVKDEEAKRIRLARNPTGRFGKPEEIVHMAVYLASDESRWTNGASLVVDGGITVNYF